MSTTEQARRGEFRETSTGLNAIAGAVLTLVAAPVLPFAAVVGGGLAGYLERDDLAGGARVGAFAGGIAAIPAFFLGWAVVGWLFMGTGGISHLPLLVGVLMLVVAMLYFVGAGAIGGALGSYLRQEF